MKQKTIFTFLALSALIITSCGTQKNQKSDYRKINGEAQGTTYHITYKDEKKVNYAESVDSIFKAIDNSVSFYVENSTLTKFNNCDSICDIDEHFFKVLWKSFEVYYNTNGNLDPTVKPLIDFWGFGGKEIKIFDVVDSSQIDSLMQFVGLEKIKFYDSEKQSVIEFDPTKNIRYTPNIKVLKTNPKIQLDFNAIAQGYTVDVISEFFLSKGIQDFLVEVGGEVRVNGKNPKGTDWTIGIDKPIEDEMKREIQAVIKLQNEAVATSGNYRKFIEKNGMKYSHTIDARTGYPVHHNLLSATIVAKDATTADGYATACMVMGLAKTKEFLKSHPELKTYLIYSDEQGNFQTYLSPDLEDKIRELEQ
ncbi:MAG: FAD:protein FMN transferase [Bacteroidetes bacterium]|nr:MAG: FAD:protein FMN transferase [Bacteroidota bacterium]